MLVDPALFERRLLDAISALSLRAHLHVFDRSCHSVAEASEASGAPADAFVKTICMVSEGCLVAAVVKGEDRASTKRVQAALAAIEVPRLATPEEMLLRTGFPVGGTPPFGFGAIFLVDERVMAREVVWGGGGSPRALVNVSPVELLKANGGRVARVRK